MSTTTTEQTEDFTEGFGEAAERYRAINEKLVETCKKTAHAALDSYEQTFGSYVDFRKQLAQATQLEWLALLSRRRTTLRPKSMRHTSLPLGMC